MDKKRISTDSVNFVKYQFLGESVNYRYQQLHVDTGFIRYPNFSPYHINILGILIPPEVFLSDLF